MPTVTLVGKADLALASGISGVLKAVGGTLVDAVANTDFTPPDSPVLANIVTTRTAADHGYCRSLINTGSVSPTTAPFADGYEGYELAGHTDNVYMRGWLQGQQTAGYPAFWEQLENYWGVNNALEYHWNYISDDGTVVYRPWGSALYRDTHALDFFMQYLTNWKLFGIGSGYGDPTPPLLQWDGTTGNLALGTGGINAASFAGDGSALTGLNAAAIATGTLEDGRFPSYLHVDSSNSLLGVRTSDMTDALAGNDFVKFKGGTNQFLGYQGNYVSFQDGTHKGIWQPNAIGSFSNEPFLLLTNSTAVATFGTDGSLVTTGPLTATGFTTTGNSIKVNSAGTYPVTLGVLSGSGNYPCLWMTSATPTLSNYTILNDEPGGGVVLSAPTYALLQAGGGGGIQVTASTTGFFGTSPVAKPTVTGSRGGNAALQSLLSGLASLGLVTNSSSA